MRFSLLCTIFLAGNGLIPACAGSPSAMAATEPRTLQVVLTVEHGVPSARARAVTGQLRALHRSIGRDFAVYPRRMRVELFASHRAFARALWTEQRLRAQTETDNSSSVVHGRLLLGPLPPDYLRHNLAHVYTEWLIDRLTGNRSNRLPSDPWIYDGVAEYEAFQHVPGVLQCSGGPNPPFDVRQVRTARRWLQLRAGPLGALEYCLAYLRVRLLVRRIGWECVVQTLRDRAGWPEAARRLKAMDHSGKCIKSRR